MFSKKTIFTTIFVIALVSNAFSQMTLAEKIAREYVVPGTIIKDGKETVGYIKRLGTTSLGEEYFSAPWEFQNDIRFMEKDAFEKAEKIKNKDFTKFEGGDIDGYRYNNDSLTFESAKYADMSAVGTGMIAKKIFMRKTKSGKITLFEHYAAPPSIGEISSLRESYIECAQPNLVYRIGKEGKLKLVNSLNVKKELTDCSTVVTKYEKGEYGTSGGEEKSGLAKLADKTVLRDAVRLAVIEDYNNVCQ